MFWRNNEVQIWLWCQCIIAVIVGNRTGILKTRNISHVLTDCTSVIRMTEDSSSFVHVSYIAAKFVSVTYNVVKMGKCYY